MSYEEFIDNYSFLGFRYWEAEEEDDSSEEDMRYYPPLSV